MSWFYENETADRKLFCMHVLLKLNVLDNEFNVIVFFRNIDTNS